MSKALTDFGEMQIIYDTSKAVYEGEYSVQYALLSLSGKVTGTESSLKMYFNIYACMRNGKCYKMLGFPAIRIPCCIRWPNRSANTAA